MTECLRDTDREFHSTHIEMQIKGSNLSFWSAYKNCRVKVYQHICANSNNVKPRMLNDLKLFLYITLSILRGI